MKIYNKILVENAKIQMGIDEDGNSFIRFDDSSTISDVVIGSENSLRGLHNLIVKYIEEYVELTKNKTIH